MRKKVVVTIVLVMVISFAVGQPATAQGSPFTFVVSADMRQYAGPGTYDTAQYFRGAVEAIDSLGAGAFMVIPGDLDPTTGVHWTLTSTLGLDYLWYPVVGNHELPGAGFESYYGANMDWLRSYDYDPNGVGVPPDIVNVGPAGCPETTFSFDYENVHFVVLNEYCDVGGDTDTDGDVPDHLYDWLVADLTAMTQTHVFVLGHEPAYPQPDADNGRLRHQNDSLNKYAANRDRFWNLLKDQGVLAYICGHTHNYSVVQIDDVWQLDTGHARGAGDLGAASTFLMIHVDGDSVTFDAYRDIHDGVYDYDDIVHNGTLAQPTALELASFAAVARDGDIEVTWETASEINNLGFNLYRAEQADEPPVQLNDSLIPSQAPGDPGGAVYTYLDENVERAQTYHYWLDQIDVYNNSTRHGPVTATVSPHRVYLPIIFK